jgi:translation initiation factor IF-3
MNFTKFKYEAQQRAKESRKKATNIVVKEMKYRPKIGGGDFETKTRKVAQFLGEGHKVKVTIMFRGREMQHPELGRRILDRVAEEVAHLGRVEAMPKQDGRNMTMVLGPDKKAQAAYAKKAAEEGADTSSEPSDAAAEPAPAADAEVIAEAAVAAEVEADAAVVAEAEATSDVPAEDAEPEPVPAPDA